MLEKSEMYQARDDERPRQSAVFDAIDAANLGKFDVDQALTPLERQGWPRLLKTLNLPPERDFIIVCSVAPALPIDLRNPGKLLDAGLLRFCYPMPLGHLMIAWQTGKHRGLAGHAGSKWLRGFRMALKGWGLTPFVCVYLDGAVHGANDFHLYLAPLYRSRLSVAVFDAGTERVGALRHSIAAFLTHPQNPQRRYGLALDALNGEGGGCVQFALRVLESAGIVPGLYPAVLRTLKLPTHLLGWPGPAPRLVDLYDRVPAACKGRFVPIWALTDENFRSSDAFLAMEAPDPALIAHAFSAMAMESKTSRAVWPIASHPSLKAQENLVEATVRNWLAREKRTNTILEGAPFPALFVKLTS